MIAMNSVACQCNLLKTSQLFKRMDFLNIFGVYSLLYINLYERNPLLIPNSIIMYKK